jgi:hypothetical protein
MSTFAVCLDPNSPNFSTSTLSSNGFSVYCDVDNFTTPVAQNIPVANLLPPPNGNCPTLINLPQGATQIIVIDQCDDTIDTAAIFNPVDVALGNLATNCCYSIIDLPPIPLGWCDECGIGFDTFEISSIGKIIAGNVTSSCGPVTDYTIGWYKDGDYSAPEIVSGYGSTFNYPVGPHPLTGNSSPLVLAGSYEGIIHDIIINGITYSTVSGSANGIPIPFESCFNTVVVDPLNCDNGTSPGKYSHQFTFNSQAVGTLPIPTSVTYVLNTSTQYFAYAFKGFGIWDELEIKWISGDPSATSNPSLYSQPIYLEKIRVGTDTIPGPFQPASTADKLVYAVTPNTTISNLNNVWPKEVHSLAENGFFQRVLTLTNLETSSNPSFPDSLEITISPNPNNNNTQWQAGFQCLDTFDCTNCIFDDYPNSLNNKIYSVSLNKQYQCPSQQLQFNTTGCLPDSISSDASDLVGFPIASYGMSNPSINLVNSRLGQTSLAAPPVSLGGQVSCNINNWNGTPSWASSWTNVNNVCLTPTNTSITFTKLPNSLQLSFNSQADYLHYKQALIGIVSSFNPNFISPKLCSNSNTDYYQIFSLTLPFQSPNSDCGDNTTNLYYFFHVNDYLSVTYVENPQNNLWSITIPQTTIVNCFTLSSCDSCYNTINNFVTGYNFHVNNAASFSYTTNKGAKYQNPFSYHNINRYVVGGASGSYCFNIPQQSKILMPWYSVNTIPFISSSNGWVNLPSLGQQLPCDLTPFSYRIQDYMQANYGVWQVRFPNLTSSFDYSLSTNNFEIYSLSGPACPTTGSFIDWWVTCPTGSLVYSYIGGVATVHTSSYFWQGNTPLLYIAP